MLHEPEGYDLLMGSARWGSGVRVGGAAVVVAAAAFQLSLLGRLFVATVRYPFDIEWLESTALYQAYRIMRGLGTYGSPRDGYLPIMHPPGHTAVLALIGRVVGLDYAMARTVSLVCFLGAAALVARALVRHAGGRAEGWALAAFAVGCAAAGVPVIDSFYTLVREDMMAVLLCVAAAALVDGTLPVPGEGAPASRRMRPRRIALVAAAITAIVYTRQPAVFFPLWIVLFVFARHRRSGFLLALAATAACGLCLVALQFASKGWYWMHTVGFLATQPLTRERFAEGFGLVSGFAPFALPILVAALVLAVLRRLSARAVLWVGMLVFSIPAGLLPYAKVGGFTNDLVPTVFLLGPAAAFVVADLLAAVAARPRAALALQASLFAAGAAFLCLRSYDHKRFVPPEESFRSARALDARVASLRGGVIASRHPFLPIHDGDQTPGWSDMPYLDMMWTGYTDLDSRGVHRPRQRALGAPERDGDPGDGEGDRAALPARRTARRARDADRRRSTPRYLMRRNDQEKDGRVLFDFEIVERVDDHRRRVPDYHAHARGAEGHRRGGRQAPGELVPPREGGPGEGDDGLAQVHDRPGSHVVAGGGRFPRRDEGGAPRGGAERAEHDGDLRGDGGPDPGGVGRAGVDGEGGAARADSTRTRGTGGTCSAITWCCTDDTRTDLAIPSSPRPVSSPTGRAAP